MMRAWATRSRFLAIWATLVASSAPAPVVAAAAADSATLRSWSSRFDTEAKAKRCKEAEAALRNIDRIAGRPSAAAHQSLALCYFRQHRYEDYEKAAEHLEIAVSQWKQAGEPYRGNLIGGLFTLAEMYGRLGDYEKKEQRLHDGLDVLGSLKPSKVKDTHTATFLQQLGELYRNQGR